MRVEFCVLGQLEVRIDGRRVNVGHSRQLCVLAALLVDANTDVPVERLIDRVWADRRPQRVRASLYSYLSRIRHTLAVTGEVELVRHSGRYRLVVDPAALDLHRFQQLVRQARAIPDDERALHLFGAALDLWRGEAFADLDVAWIDDVRAGLRRDRHAAELDRNDVALRVGRHGPLLSEMATQAADQPMDERLVGQLMLALYRNGRQAEALDRYQRTRKLLAEELGTDPSPPLRALHQRMLRADPGLAGSEAKPVPSAAPDPPPPAAAGSAGALPRQLPPAPTLFVGRDRELHELDSTGPLVVLSGMPGIGKTSLAVHWAHRTSGRFTDGQLFVNLRGYGPGPALTPVEALAHLLQALGVPAHLTPNEEQRASGLFRSLTADKRLVVVLDDAAGAEQVRPLLPGGQTVRVLVTSRVRLAGLVARDGAREIALRELPHDNAVELLRHVLGGDCVASEAPAASELVELCGGLPLALRIAAATVNRMAANPLATFVGRLRTDGRIESLAVRDDPAAALNAAFEQSYRVLGPARSLFRLLGALPVTDLEAPAAAAAGDCTVPQARAQLEQLADAHMLLRTAPGRYGPHDLLREYARRLCDETDPPQRRVDALRRTYRWYLGQAEAAAQLLYPQLARLPIPAASRRGAVDEVRSDLDDTAAAARWLARERHNLVAIATTADRDGAPEFSWLLSSVLRGDFMACRDIASWLAVAEAALTAAASHGDLAGQAAAHLSLGTGYVTVGDYFAGIRHSERAVVLAGRSDWHHGQAAALNVLGICCSYLGQTRRAVDHFEQAHTLYRSLAEHSGIAIVLNNLGTISTLRGDLDNAEAQLRQALSLYTTAGARRGAASATLNLGVVHRHRGETTAARQRLTTAAETYRDLRDIEGEASALTHLALTDLIDGRVVEALRHARVALASLRSTGDLHAQALALCALAAVRRDLHQHLLAGTLFRAALRLATQVSSGQATIEALNGLADLHQRLCENTAAVSYASQALATAEACGYEPSAADARRILALAQASEGHNDTATILIADVVRTQQHTGYRMNLANARAAQTIIDAMAPSGHGPA